MALAKSRRLGVGMGAGLEGNGIGDRSACRGRYFPPNPTRLSRTSGPAVGPAVGIHVDHRLFEVGLLKLGLV